MPEVSLLVTIILAIGALFAFGLAYYFWQKSHSYYTLLIEGANRFEEFRTKNLALEERMRSFDDEFKLQKQQHKAQTAELHSSREKLKLLENVLQTKDQELAQTRETLLTQKQHLQTQLEKTMLQVVKLRDRNQEIEERLQTESVKNQEKWQSDVTSLQERLKASETALAAMKKQVEDSTSAASEEAELNIKRLKRRLTQSHRLFQSMKGLKEIAEERSQNWETALSHLSKWVLRKEKPQDSQESWERCSLGALVAEAMQATGSQLIDDELVHQTSYTKEEQREQHKNFSEAATEIQLGHHQTSSVELP